MWLYCAGILPWSEFIVLLTVMCQCTCYPAAYPLRLITIKLISKALILCLFLAFQKQFCLISPHVLILLLSYKGWHSWVGISSFHSLFSDVPTWTHVSECDFDVGMAQLVKKHACWVYPIKRELLRKVDYLLTHNLAEHNFSSWLKDRMWFLYLDNIVL